MIAPRPCCDTSAREGATISGSLPRTQWPSKVQSGQRPRLLLRGREKEQMRPALQAAMSFAAWICFLCSVQIITAVQAHSGPLHGTRHGGEAAAASTAQAGTRTLSGRIVTDKNESVGGLSILVRYPGGQQATVSDAEGNFH